MSSNATDSSSAHAVDTLQRGRGASAGRGRQVTAYQPKFNVPSWPRTVSPSSKNAFKFGRVWLSNANQKAMVYFGDGGGNCTWAPPIGFDPGSV